MKAERGLGSLSEGRHGRTNAAPWRHLALLGSALLAAAFWPGDTHARDLPAGTLVALGSSYAAGDGVGIMDPARRSCRNSLSSAARQLAHDLSLEMVDASCAGASTADILTRAHRGFGPQIEAVNSRTRVVYLTVGGNDAAYIGNLFAWSCRTQRSALQSTPKPCHRPRHIVPALATRPGHDLASTAARLARLPQRLRNVLAAIHSRAPLARILVVGYLPVVPSGPLCPAVPLNTQDAERARHLWQGLEQATEKAAHAAGAIYLSGAQAGGGHEACSATPYVTGWDAAVPYHPNQAGMDHIASLLARRLRQDPAFTAPLPGSP
ncbi:SGNH/GDSL hydrolase family protein [Oecophyllibacter saccharovorans]|nr:SGNH/GDSL hydrolase family protein [Oecophyllibacter saccharovorans]